MRHRRPAPTRMLLLAILLFAVFAAHASPDSPPLMLVDNGTTWTLDNGIVKATIRKGSVYQSSVEHKVQLPAARRSGTAAVTNE